MPRSTIATRALGLSTFAFLLSSCILDEYGLAYPVRLEALTPLRVDTEAGASITLEVRVISNEGQAMAGPEVRWSTADGSVVPASGSWGDGGLYSTTWTLPDVPGVYAARATSPHLEPITFVAEVVAPAARQAA